MGNNIIQDQINILQEKYNIIIEDCGTDATGLCWNFKVSPAQSNEIINEIENILDDTLDEYEEAISSHFTFDGHYFANVENK